LGEKLPVLLFDAMFCSMNDRVKNLAQEARKLAVADRAALIDDLLASLDTADARIDALWAEEAERRAVAVDSGEMLVRDATDILTDLRARHGR
jgi:hypothetical protein